MSKHTNNILTKGLISNNPLPILFYLYNFEIILNNDKRKTGSGGYFSDTESFKREINNINYEDIKFIKVNVNWNPKNKKLFHIYARLLERSIKVELLNKYKKNDIKVEIF